MKSQNGYPAPAGHRPAYWITDGRHRWCGAIYNGKIRELRVDVIDGDGHHGLRVIPLEELTIDPEVQFPFAYSDTRAHRIGREWDDLKVGVLTVFPIKNALSAPERSKIKLGLDRDRRYVSPLESFLTELHAGEQETNEINALTEDVGFHIGRLRSRQPYDRLECVTALRSIYRSLGPAGYRRTLTLNTHWKGDPKTNTMVWLTALSLLARDGYDQILTPRSWVLWKEVVPAIEIRKAQGESEASGGIVAVAYILAANLRKRARLKSLPVQTLSKRAVHSRPF